MLLAGMTALFMALGYTPGGAGGALIALLVAAGLNLFTFWNADRIARKMHGPPQVTEGNCPGFLGPVRDRARPAGPPRPEVHTPAQRDVLPIAPRCASPTIRAKPLRFLIPGW